MTVDEAERHIARILCGLEKEHDAYVENLSIMDVDATRFNDEQQKILRRVKITLKRRPGSLWMK